MCVCVFLLTRNLFCLHAKSCFRFKVHQQFCFFPTLAVSFFFFNSPTVPIFVTWKYFFISFSFLWCLSFITSVCHALCSTHFITCDVATFLSNSHVIIEDFLYPYDSLFPFYFSTSLQQPLSSELRFWKTLRYFGPSSGETISPILMGDVVLLCCC